MIRPSRYAHGCRPPLAVERRCGGRLIGVVVVTAALMLFAVPGAAQASGEPPSCVAVLFVPADGEGVFAVEQPEQASGGIYCDDPEDDQLSFVVVRPPAHGTLSSLTPNGLGGAELAYSPALGYTGPDSYLLQANDGSSDSAVEVQVSVRAAANDPPECAGGLLAERADDGSYRVRAGVATAGWVSCVDDEGDPLSFAIAEAPTAGSLSALTPDGAGGADFAYTPTLGAGGSDRIRLVASDGAHESAPVELLTTVVASTDPSSRCGAALATSVDGSGAFEVEQGEAVHGTVVCEPREGHQTSFGIATPPSHGSLGPLSPTEDDATDFTYTAGAGFSGWDSFQMRADDDAGAAELVELRVRVLPARNDPPSCTAELLAPTQGDGYELSAGHPVEGRLSCVDDEGDPLVLERVGLPAHGTLSALADAGEGAATFTYTPAEAYAGADAFQLQANDGAHDSNVVGLTVAVHPSVADAPSCELSFATSVAPDGSFAVKRGEPSGGRIVCADRGGHELAFSVAAPPAHGSLSGVEHEGPASGHFTYTPAAGFTGTDSLQLRARDGVADSGPLEARVTVVAPSNKAPSCRAVLSGDQDSSGAYVVEAGETVAGSVICFDEEHDDLAMSVLQSPVHGTLGAIVVGVNGSARFSYTAAPGYTGPDVARLTARDALHDSNPIELAIEVAVPRNDAPTCSAALFSEPDGLGAYQAEQGESEQGTLLCSDDEGAPLSYAVVDAPAHGELTQLVADDTGASFGYRPAAGYLGPDSFTLRASDGSNQSELVELKVAVVAARNDPPDCQADLAAPRGPGGIAQLDPGQATAGEILCFDDEGDPLSFQLVAPPAHGALSPFTADGTDATFTYTPGAGYAGPDAFDLRASDGTSSSSTVRVQLTVKGVPTPPDTTAPTTTDDVPAGVQPAPVAVTLTAVDEPGGSGVDVTHYEAGTNPPNPTAQSPVYHPTAKPVLGNGGQIAYFSVDKSGNVEAVRRSRIAKVAAPRGGNPPPGGPAGPATPPTSPPSTGGGPRSPCIRLKGRRLAACRVEQSVKRSCGSLKGKRKRTCAKRVRALARCSKLKGARKRQCTRRAKAIGRPRR